MAIKLTSAGQIKEGDHITVEFKGLRIRFIARKILRGGTRNEEVVVHIGSNKYFITQMAIAGESWAKNVQIVQ